jgi:hypothetical protein
LPTEAALVAAAAIDELLAGLNGDVTGICSLADGTDQIFAARVLERGFRLQAILPCHEYEDTFVEEDSRASFLELLAMADHCETLDFQACSEEAYLAAGQRVVDLTELVVVVWDGEVARGVGGTADIVDYAKAKGRELLIVWPDNVVR